MQALRVLMDSTCFVQFFFSSKTHEARIKDESFVLEKIKKEKEKTAKNKQQNTFFSVAHGNIDNMDKHKEKL